MPIRHTVQKIFNHFGYDLARVTSLGRTRSTLAQAYAHLKETGFYPATVLDIGVAEGTPELYRTFPDSYFLLVEPLEAFEPHISAILEQVRGSHVKAAAGPKAGQVNFNVHDDQLEGSSLYKESMGKSADGHELKVPMVRLDDVLESKNCSGPFLMKIDVQGAELDVLDGAHEALSQSEVVCLEVSLFEFMKGAPQLHDVIAYMKKCGFVAYDIIPGWNRPLDNALGQVDIVFVREFGRFRTDHAFSTREQRQSLFGS